MSLEALERSDLARLPGGIFTRAFVRAYAEEVGLDPDRTIEDFIAELPPEVATATAHPASLEDGEKLDSDRKAAVTAIRLILVSVPMIGLVIYYGTHWPPASYDVATPAPIALPAPAPDATEAVDRPVEPQMDGFTMEIAPRASCWVSVTVDGSPGFSGLMGAGDVRVIRAKEEILLNVGDAGAFAYTVNGRPGRSLGAPGEVVSQPITASTLDEFVGR